MKNLVCLTIHSFGCGFWISALIDGQSERAKCIFWIIFCFVFGILSVIPLVNKLRSK